MSLLQVRDIPEDLYENLAKVAKKENRSIAQETVVLLRKALDLKEEHISRRTGAKILTLDKKLKGISEKQRSRYLFMEEERCF